MFCPQCGDEFVPGVRECPDCRVTLAAEPRPKPRFTAEAVELVTVLATRDPGELMVAKSVLEAEGIRYLVKGDGLQTVFGYGNLGAAFNLLVAPVRLQVAAKDAEDARAVLGTCTE